MLMATDTSNYSLATWTPVLSRPLLSKLPNALVSAIVTDLKLVHDLQDKQPWLSQKVPLGSWVDSLLEGWWLAKYLWGYMCRELERLIQCCMQALYWCLRRPCAILGGWVKVFCFLLDARTVDMGDKWNQRIKIVPLITTTTPQS